MSLSFSSQRKSHVKISKFDIPSSFQSHFSTWSDSVVEKSGQWDLLRLLSSWSKSLYQHFRSLVPAMSQPIPNTEPTHNQQTSIPVRHHDRYRPFHHPFSVQSPGPRTDNQQDRFPIFFDRRPPNRLEALVLGEAAQKFNGYGRYGLPSHRENEAKHKEEGKPKRGSAVSLKLQSPPLPQTNGDDSKPPPDQDRRTTVSRIRYLFTKFVIEWWLLELVSWVFSALCMTTIISVLWYYDNKELPQWGFGVTLNVFISVFSNLARASLLLPTAEALGQLKWNWFRRESKTMMDFEILDSASRGPWGALVLLVRTRGRYVTCVDGMTSNHVNLSLTIILCRTLASIGAAIVIFILPLELFFQQIVLYPSVWVPVNPPPPIARTTTYALPTQVVYVNGVKALTEDQYLYSLVSPFFYSNPSLPSVEFSCPTTNCSWEPFDTLAVCSSCSEDVTQLLNFGCYPSKADWFNNVTLSLDTSSYPNITACGYWLNATSDSRVLMTGYALDPSTGLPGEALEMRLFPLIDTFTRLPYYGGSINFQHTVNPLMDILIVGIPGLGGNVYANATPVAYECVLSWCTQRMSSSFYWGHVSENVTQRYENTTDLGYPWLTKMDKNNIPAYAYLHNITITPPDQPRSDNPDEDRAITFGTTSTNVLSTIFTLDLLAPSFLTIGNESNDPLFKYKTKTHPESRPMTVNPWMPPNNVSQHMANLATAMTRGIRNTQSSDGSFETINGTAWDQVLHVQIRWPWVSLPLVLLTAGLIFLLATVIRSSKESDEVGIWKTSALAILFNGLGEDVQRSVSPGCRMGEARARARELSVKLLPD